MDGLSLEAFAEIKNGGPELLDPPVRIRLEDR